jgi:uncharacterized Zn-binding protein involved in type VI secretion
MAASPAARIGDPVTHDLTAPSGVVGPPVTPPLGNPVIIEYMPAAFVGCTVVCSGATSAGMAHPPPVAGAPPVPIVIGSPTVWINGMPAARWAPSGDSAACTAQIGNAAQAATRTVLIGMASSAGPLALGDFFDDGDAIKAPHKPKKKAREKPPPIYVDEDGLLRVGKNIVVIGSESFQASVLEALREIASHPSGIRVLNTIEKHGKLVSIHESEDWDCYARPSDWEASRRAGTPLTTPEGKPVTDWAGAPLVGTGAGSSARVDWNPDYLLRNSRDPNNPMPTDAVLFHELNHASHQTGGTEDSTPTTDGYDNREERATIDGDFPSEKTYLRERGYPWHRVNHNQKFEPFP